MNESAVAKDTDRPLSPVDVRDWLPPLISISSPNRDSITVTQKNFVLRAEVLSNTQPIADVKVLQNGTLKAGGGASSANGMRRQIEVELELEPGRNIISVIASNEKAVSEPETRTIIYNSSSSGAAIYKPKLIALAIGISQYQRRELNLNYADADATAMESALGSQADPQHILQ